VNEQRELAAMIRASSESQAASDLVRFAHRDVESIAAALEKGADAIDALDELIAECDRTLQWRQGGMRPAGDTSTFAFTALSSVINTRRFLMDMKNRGSNQ
jgi:hypothetical protein